MGERGVKMKKIKKYGVIVLICIMAISMSVIYYKNKDWTIRFKSELDLFFGEGKWECISEETKESIIYTEYISVRSNPALSGEVPGKYTDWNIKFLNKEGNQEIWKITNHTLKINNDKYGFFSSKRYSNKQALVLELMEISCGLAGEEVFNNIYSEYEKIDNDYEYYGPKENCYNNLWFEFEEKNKGVDYIEPSELV